LFVELMPLLKQRTLLITVARIDEKLKVNVIPAKAKEGEGEALTTPLSYTGSPEELDRELGVHLASYVDSHLALGSTLAEAKGEMDAGGQSCAPEGEDRATDLKTRYRHQEGGERNTSRCAGGHNAESLSCTNPN
jgi:PRTRC genetic system protein E